MCSNNTDQIRYTTTSSVKLPVYIPIFLLFRIKLKFGGNICSLRYIFVTEKGEITFCLEILRCINLQIGICHFN